MKVYSICSFQEFGTLEMQGDGVKMQIALTLAEAKQFMELAAVVYAARQANFVCQIDQLPMLEAPKKEGEEAEYEPIPF